MNKGQTDYQADEIPVEDETIATAQEAAPLPYIGGTRMLAVRWIDTAEQMVAEQTSNVIGKK